MARDASTSGSASRGLTFQVAQATGDDPPQPPRTRERRRLMLHGAAVAGIGLLLTFVWATTTGGFFWPIQALLPLALTVAIHAWFVLLDERPQTKERFLGSKPLAAHLGIAAAMWLYLVALWAVGGRGYFWPAWALLGLAAYVGLHALETRHRRNTS
jgi:hypothetical protein